MTEQEPEEGKAGETDNHDGNVGRTQHDALDHDEKCQSSSTSVMNDGPPPEHVITTSNPIQSHLNRKQVKINDVMIKHISTSIAVVRIPNKGHGMINISDKPIPPNTDLIIEKPFHEWPRGGYDIEKLTAELLFRVRRDTTGQISKALSTLCPVALHHIPQARRDQISDTCINSILTQLDAMEKAQPSPLKDQHGKKLMKPTRSEVLRHLYIFECNSFPSGLNLAISNVNHSCDPNADVTEHDHDELEDKENGLNNNLTKEESEGAEKPRKSLYYHLQSAREIAPGEEITISYIHVGIQVELAEDRQRHLEEHYLFHCVCSLCEGGEPIGDGGNGPVTSRAPRREDLRCGFWEEQQQSGGKGGKSGINGSGRSATEMMKGCGGQLSSSFGACYDCGLTIPMKLLKKGHEKVDKLVLKLRNMVNDAYMFMEEFGAKAEEALDAELVLTKLDGRNPRTLVGEFDRSKVTVREMIRQFEEMEKKASALLHVSHIVFVPFNRCLERLRQFSFILDPNQKNGPGKVNTRKPTKKEEVRSNDNSSNSEVDDTSRVVDAVLPGLERLNL
jgi:hypothetical protein